MALNENQNLCIHDIITRMEFKKKFNFETIYVEINLIKKTIVNEMAIFTR